MVRYGGCPPVSSPPPPPSVLQVTGRDVALRGEHVGLRDVLGEVVEVVPPVVLLGVLRLDLEHREQDPLHFHAVKLRPPSFWRQTTDRCPLTPNGRGLACDRASGAVSGVRTTGVGGRGGGARPGAGPGRRRRPRRGRGPQLPRRPHRRQPLPGVGSPSVRAGERVRGQRRRRRERRHPVRARRPRVRRTASSARSRRWCAPPSGR